MKKIIGIGLFFVLAFVGYANAQYTVYKGNMNFTVNVTDEIETQDIMHPVKLVASTQTFRGHLVLYLVMDGEDPLVQGPNGYHIELLDQDDEIIIGIDTYDFVTTDNHNGLKDGFKIVGTGLHFAPDTGLQGIAYMHLNMTIYYNIPDDLTKIVSKFVLNSGKIGGAIRGDSMFAAALNVTTLTSTHPD